MKTLDKRLSLSNKRFKSATKWTFKNVSVLKAFFNRNLFVYKFKPIVTNKFVAPSPQNEMLLANHKIVIRKYNLERKNAGESSPFTRDILGGGPIFLLKCNNSNKGNPSVQLIGIRFFNECLLAGTKLPLLLMCQL